jgi:hypothetical protein
VAEDPEVPDLTPARSAAAALLVVQATASENTPIWPEALSNASSAPLGQDFSPVLEVVDAFSDTFVKPAFFAEETVRRSFARDLGDVTVLAQAGIAAAATNSTTAMARTEILRLTARAGCESDRDITPTGWHRFMTQVYLRPALGPPAVDSGAGNLKHAA